jgi:hypothetical protein
MVRRGKGGKDRVTMQLGAVVDSVYTSGRLRSRSLGNSVVCKRITS